MLLGGLTRASNVCSVVVLCEPGIYKELGFLWAQRNTVMTHFPANQWGAYTEAVICFYIETKTGNS